ncbi:hypothetical protein ScPMuIL_008736 [Solemya velum]
MGRLTLPCLTTVALMTGLLCFVISSVSACSCLPLSNQENFCVADFAVRARVIKVTPAPDDFSDHVFEIKIMKVFKQKSDSGLHGGDKLTLKSPANGGLCGVKLTENTAYFLSGDGSPPTSLNSCRWISEWSKMTAEEKRGVKGQYQCGLQKVTPAVVDGVTAAVVED